MFVEGLAVVRPGPQTDQRCKVVRHNQPESPLGVEPGNAPQLGNGALSGEGGNAAQEQFLAAVGQPEPVLAALDHLDHQVRIFGHDPSWQDAQDARARQVFPCEFAHLTDPRAQVRVLLLFQVHLLPGRLVLFRMGRIGVSVDQGPGTVLGVEIVALETVIVVAEGESNCKKRYLRR